MPSAAVKAESDHFGSGIETTACLFMPEALCEIGIARDVRLQTAVKWLLAKQDSQGWWKNEYAYNGKTWVDFELQGAPGKCLQRFQTVAGFGVNANSAWTPKGWEISGSSDRTRP